MIGSLRGTLLELSSSSGDSCAEAIVESGGVGYRVVLPGSVATQLGSPGEPVFVRVHTHVKEDALVLYGFADPEQLRCFEALIGVHGVGPSLALAILGVHPPAALRAAVVAGDVDALVLVPGVGRKTAARLLIELEASLEDLGAPRQELRVAPVAGAGVHGDVREALSGLGYGAEEVREALRSLPEAGATEDLLRQALHALAGAR